MRLHSWLGGKQWYCRKNGRGKSRIDAGRGMRRFWHISPPELMDARLHASSVKP
jgi:hypothetical protein